MYFNLALRNVKKSFKDYLIYFLTLAFSICLFYTFNSFQEQQSVLEMSAAQSDIIISLQQLMKILSFIVALILAFLIIYANNFLIKRRKKELGLYTLLGMPKQLISRVLVYETFFIGLVSLVVGITLGTIASQLLTVVTANMFEVVLNYKFIFSMDAMIFTIISFAIIFFIIMIFNTFTLNRYKLIDLLTADRRNETLKIKNVYVSFILFLLSVALLGFTYWFALDQGYEALMYLGIIAPCGIIGTILFFMSLSGFLLKFVQCSKKLYYKRLNMFVLRQINSSINSNFISMSVVCLMLLFSIGALATGANLNKTINNTILSSTVYDFSYSHLYQYSNIDNIKEILDVDTTQIKDDFFVHEYNSDETLDALLPYIKDQTIIAGQNDEHYTVIALSDYNRLRRDRGLDEVTLKQNEAHLFTSADMISTMVYDILQAKPTLQLYGNEIKIVNDDFDLLQGSTTLMTGTFMMTVVVNDDMIPSDAALFNTYWNVMLKDGVDQTTFYETMKAKMTSYNETMCPSYEQSDCDVIFREVNIANQNSVKENSKGASVTLTYIGIYLGIVFLIASAVILALQQLSQASDNVARYRILNKIGAEKSMLNHAILLQLSLYFFMPLLLGVIHSIVGIQVVNMLVQVFGQSDIFGASVITAGIIILIYGSYFFVTYLGTKRILTK